MIRFVFVSLHWERAVQWPAPAVVVADARYHHHYQRVATLGCCLGSRLGSSLMQRHEGAVRDSQPGGLPRSQGKPPHSFCSLLTCTKSTPAYRQQDIQGHDRLSTALRDLTLLAHQQTSQSGSQPARKPGTQAARQDGQDGPGSLTFNTPFPTRASRLHKTTSKNNGHFVRPYYIHASRLLLVLIHKRNSEKTIMNFTILVCEWEKIKLEQETNMKVGRCFFSLVEFSWKHSFSDSQIRALV